MNKTLITTLALTTLLTGCGESAKQTLVKQYFTAMQNKDVNTLKAILKSAFKQGWKVEFSPFSIRLNLCANKDGK